MRATEYKKRGFSFTLLGLILAALGVAAPIVWDWWSTKSELTLTKDQRVNLFEKKTSIDGLSVTYLDHEVENLSKIVFTLENTGRTPIENSDLVSLPTLKITEGKLLSASIDLMTPENLGAALTQTEKTVAISFPLLNPEDSITFSTLISGKNFSYQIESRVKNISAIISLDENDQIRIRSSFGITTYIVGFFVVLFFITFIGLATQTPRRNRAHRAILQNSTPARCGEKLSTVISYIDNELSFLSKLKRKKLKAIAQKSDSHLDEETTEELQEALRSIISSENPGGGAFICLIIVSSGIYYIYSNIVI